MGTAESSRVTDTTFSEIWSLSVGLGGLGARIPDEAPSESRRPLGPSTEQVYLLGGGRMLPRSQANFRNPDRSYSTFK